MDILNPKFLKFIVERICKDKDFNYSLVLELKNLVERGANLELFVEEYNMSNKIPNKVYFRILNDFSLNSSIIKDELNTLISFLQQ